ncbi:hypothetical protein [Amycolatopsis vastitatis]|uniref:hypothetical protein n=1 Tax=Amycolatopsis vastitatis TaxID=1905142 RepID=UPI0026BAD4D0
MTVHLVIARPRRGVVGETRRLAHLFEIRAEHVVPESLTALCGIEFTQGQLELLDGLSGMPCESCLRLSPPPAFPQAARIRPESGGEAMTASISGAPRSDLDPVLLQPVRLFVACLLADTDWHRLREIQTSLGLPGPDLDLHLQFLRASGYLHSRGQDELRLTTLGLARLMAHIIALQGIAAAAAELVAGQRDRARRDSPPASPGPPTGPAETRP